MLSCNPLDASCVRRISSSPSFMDKDSITLALQDITLALQEIFTLAVQDSL